MLHSVELQNDYNKREAVPS